MTDAEILALVREAVEYEKSQGFNVYMKPIERALQGKALKKRKKPRK